MDTLLKDYEEIIKLYDELLKEYMRCVNTNFELSFRLDQQNEFIKLLTWRDQL